VARNACSRIATATDGFTLVDMLLVTAFMAIIMATAVPTLRNVGDSIRLGAGAREVERELQTARLKAVTTNSVMRLRFNCPVAGQYRMVELMAAPGAPLAGPDAAADRCTDTAYPYPAADLSPITVPNHDGPVRRLHPDLSFGAFKTLEFWPDGTVRADDGTGERPWKPIAGAGTAITVVKGANVKTITVNGLGKITLQ